jgi:hypothetical protein
MCATNATLQAKRTHAARIMRMKLAVVVVLKSNSSVIITVRPCTIMCRGRPLKSGNSVFPDTQGDHAKPYVVALCL